VKLEYWNAFLREYSLVYSLVNANANATIYGHSAHAVWFTTDKTLFTYIQQVTQAFVFDAEVYYSSAQHLRTYTVHTLSSD
jgi:hypothetical protein